MKQQAQFPFVLVSFIPFFTEHIRAFKFHMSAKTHKTDCSLVNEAFILGVFCTSGRSIYCNSFGRGNIGSEEPYLSTMLSPCHGQQRSLYLFPMNSACLACRISVFFTSISSPEIQSRYPEAICTQFKPQFYLLQVFKENIFFLCPIISALIQRLETVL